MSTVYLIMARETLTQVKRKCYFLLHEKICRTCFWSLKELNNQARETLNHSTDEGADHGHCKTALSYPPVSGP